MRLPGHTIIGRACETAQAPWSKRGEHLADASPLVLPSGKCIRDRFFGRPSIFGEELSLRHVDDCGATAGNGDMDGQRHPVPVALPLSHAGRGNFAAREDVLDEAGGRIPLLQPTVSVGLSTTGGAVSQSAVEGDIGRRCWGDAGEAHMEGEVKADVVLGERMHCHGGAAQHGRPLCRRSRYQAGHSENRRKHGCVDVMGNLGTPRSMVFGYGFLKEFFPPPHEAKIRD